MTVSGYNHSFTHSFNKYFLSVCHGINTRDITANKLDMSLLSQCYGLMRDTDNKQANTWIKKHLQSVIVQVWF